MYYCLHKKKVGLVHPFVILLENWRRKRNLSKMWILSILTQTFSECPLQVCVFCSQTFTITGQFFDLFKLVYSFKKIFRFRAVRRWAFKADIGPLFVFFLLCFYFLRRLVFTRKLCTVKFSSPHSANIVNATFATFTQTIKKESLWILDNSSCSW